MKSGTALQYRPVLFATYIREQNACACLQYNTLDDCTRTSSAVTSCLQYFIEDGIGTARVQFATANKYGTTAATGDTQPALLSDNSTVCVNHSIIQTSAVLLYIFNYHSFFVINDPFLAARRWSEDNIEQSFMYPLKYSVNMGLMLCRFHIRYATYVLHIVSGPWHLRSSPSGNSMKRMK